MLTYRQRAPGQANILEGEKRKLSRNSTDHAPDGRKKASVR